MGLIGGFVRVVGRSIGWSVDRSLFGRSFVTQCRISPFVPFLYMSPTHYTTVRMSTPLQDRCFTARSDLVLIAFYFFFFWLMLKHWNCEREPGFLFLSSSFSLSLLHFIFLSTLYDRLAHRSTLASLQNWIRGAIINFWYHFFDSCVFNPFFFFYFFFFWFTLNFHFRTASYTYLQNWYHFWFCCSQCLLCFFVKTISYFLFVYMSRLFNTNPIHPPF